ncbi:MAG: hypothetical protein GY701_35145 [Sulfitobacter sp.]|nr:hypothetical protein [Sulfitobacter sp.]
MRFEAGVQQDDYPLRPLSPVGVGGNHSLGCSDIGRRRVKKQFARFCRQISQGEINLHNRSVYSDELRSRQLDTTSIAREFAVFSTAVSTVHGISVSNEHVESAYALLHRRVEGVAARADRMIIAGLAVAALIRTGMRVHLVVDGQHSILYMKRWLLPIFEQTGIVAGVIESGDDEHTRSSAYRQSVTLVSARECALDFLRDAYKWPDRSNSALRSIDRMLGAKSRQSSLLMTGLPCAILIDIDSTLIDNARTPIVLTSDAHPMHEGEELRRALEMVEHLEIGQHFVLTGKEAEVVLTEAGKGQLDAWANQIGGIWATRHLAELMLCVAIVVTHLVKSGTHYRISKHSVEWLVHESLVPGMEFYTRPFVTRLVEVRENCTTIRQRGVVERASYQQVFNRYIHLCGLCHSIDRIEHELNTIYGLKSRQCGSPVNRSRFEKSHLLQSNEEKIEWLKEWVRFHDTSICRVIIVNSLDMLEHLDTVLTTIVPDLRALSEPNEFNLKRLLKPGALIVVLAHVMDYLLPIKSDVICCPVRIVVAQRSSRYSEDQRNLYWMQGQKFSDFKKTVLLALDDELFAGSSIDSRQNRYRIFGSRIGGYLLEQAILRIQITKGRELYKVRRDLLTYDANMQGLLSFSGRGLYE